MRHLVRQKLTNAERTRAGVWAETVCHSVAREWVVRACDKASAHRHGDAGSSRSSARDPRG